MTPADTLVSRARAIDALPENKIACPFCGCLRLSRVVADELEWTKCGDCGALGPVEHPGGDRVTWNTRAVVAPPVPAFPDQLRNLAQKWADKNETHAAMMIRKAADVIEGKA